MPRAGNRSLGRAPGPRTHNELAQVGDGGIDGRLGFVESLLLLLWRNAEQGSDDVLAQEGEVCPGERGRKSGDEPGLVVSARFFRTRRGGCPSAPGGLTTHPEIRSSDLKAWWCGLQVAIDRSMGGCWEPVRRRKSARMDRQPANLRPRQVSSGGEAVTESH